MPVFEMEEPAAKEDHPGGPIADDEYFPAEITRIMIKTRKNRDGEEYKRTLWRFVISDPDGEQDGRTLFGETGAKLVDHPDCKLKVWSENVTGQQLTKETVKSFDTDVMEGMTCTVVVGYREYEKEGQTHVHNWVKEILPTRHRLDSPF